MTPFSSSVEVKTATANKITCTNAPRINYISTRIQLQRLIMEVVCQVGEH